MFITSYQCIKNTTAIMIGKERRPISPACVKYMGAGAVEAKAARQQE
jgi:hypothetical protein